MSADLMGSRHVAEAEAAAAWAYPETVIAGLTAGSLECLA